VTGDAPIAREDEEVVAHAYAGKAESAEAGGAARARS
jgi:hypothetical protein